LHEPVRVRVRQLPAMVLAPHFRGGGWPRGCPRARFRCYALRAGGRTSAEVAFGESLRRLPPSVPAPLPLDGVPPRLLLAARDGPRVLRLRRNVVHGPPGVPPLRREVAAPPRPRALRRDHGYDAALPLRAGAARQRRRQLRAGGRRRDLRPEPQLG